MRNGFVAEVKVSHPEGDFGLDAVTRARAPVLGRHETTIPPIHSCHGSRDPGPRGRAVLLRHRGPDDHRCPGQERDHRRQGHQEQVRHRQGPQEEVGGEEAHQEERDHLPAGEGRLAERDGPALRHGHRRARPGRLGDDHRPLEERPRGAGGRCERLRGRQQRVRDRRRPPPGDPDGDRHLPGRQGRRSRPTPTTTDPPTWPHRRCAAPGPRPSPRRTRSRSPSWASTRSSSRSPASAPADPTPPEQTGALRRPPGPAERPSLASGGSGHQIRTRSLGSSQRPSPAAVPNAWWNSSRFRTMLARNSGGECGSMVRYCCSCSVRRLVRQQ